MFHFAHHSSPHSTRACVLFYLYRCKIHWDFVISRNEWAGQGTAPRNPRPRCAEHHLKAKHLRLRDNEHHPGADGRANRAQRGFVLPGALPFRGCGTYRQCLGEARGPWDSPQILSDTALILEPNLRLLVRFQRPSTPIPASTFRIVQFPAWEFPGIC
jgi:hypothetical protein